MTSWAQAFQARESEARVSERGDTCASASAIARRGARHWKPFVGAKLVWPSVEQHASVDPEANASRLI